MAQVVVGARRQTSTLASQIWPILIPRNPFCAVTNLLRQLSPHLRVSELRWNELKEPCAVCHRTLSHHVGLPCVRHHFTNSTLDSAACCLSYSTACLFGQCSVALASFLAKVTLFGCLPHGSAIEALSMDATKTWERRELPTPGRLTCFLREVRRVTCATCATPATALPSWAQGTRSSATTSTQDARLPHCFVGCRAGTLLLHPHSLVLRIQFRHVHFVPSCGASALVLCIQRRISRVSWLDRPPSLLFLSAVAPFGSSDFDRAMSIMSHSRAQRFLFFFCDVCDLGDLTQATRLQPGIHHEGPEGWTWHPKSSPPFHCRVLRHLGR